PCPFSPQTNQEEAMKNAAERAHDVGKPTSSPNAGKIPDATREDNRRKGESRQIAGEGGDRAPQKQREKADTRRAGGPGRADDDTQARDADDADRERTMLDRAPAEGRR
ncbi:MAG TPA: hypothetical protein VG894_07810, partial [Bauldia sp.]|nr:hypothetical protein [Bauldia sp.]